MSASNSIFTLFFELSNAKKWVEKSFLNPPRSQKLNVPKHISLNFKVDEFLIFNKLVVTVQPHSNVTNTHILFFHGGAYLLEGSTLHWKLVTTFLSKTNCKVSYIDYPLAPENTYKQTFEMVQQSFEKLINDYPADQFIFVGDSAGGGLALAFAQKLLLDNAAVQPVKIILFSPWLDLSMQNTDIKHQEALDKLLPFDGLIRAGLHYAEGEDLRNYLLSPLNGKLDGLGETHVFYGTHELFYPDCKKLKQLTQGFDNFTFHEFPEMQHDWVVYPIPEAKQALDLAIEFIKNESGIL